jgi:hypothetical protein
MWLSLADWYRKIPFSRYTPSCTVPFQAGAKSGRCCQNRLTSLSADLFRLSRRTLTERSTSTVVSPGTVEVEIGFTAKYSMILYEFMFCRCTSTIIASRILDPCICQFPALRVWHVKSGLLPQDWLVSLDIGATQLRKLKSHDMCFSIKRTTSHLSLAHRVA